MNAAIHKADQPAKVRSRFFQREGAVDLAVMGWESLSVVVLLPPAKLLPLLLVQPLLRSLFAIAFVMSQLVF
jgi:hypothetical protein